MSRDKHTESAVDLEFTDDLLNTQYTAFTPDGHTESAPVTEFIDDWSSTRHTATIPTMDFGCLKRDRESVSKIYSERIFKVMLLSVLQLVYF